MHAFFEFLRQNPYILLFFTVGMAVFVGKFSVKGYGLGMVAAAVVVGAALSTWASLYGVQLQLDAFAKSLFYYLFMYGVGLRVGPSFFNSLKKDGLKFTILAVVCSVTGLALVDHRREAAQAAARRGRWHPGRFADDVRGDRHRRDGGVAGGLPDPGRLHGGADLGNDRARLRRDVHLRHHRHHPDLQVPAALVGCRCQKGGQGIRARPRRRERRRYRPHGLPARGPAGLSTREPGGRRPDRLRNFASRSRSIGSPMSCAAASSSGPRPNWCSSSATSLPSAVASRI